MDCDDRPGGQRSPLALGHGARGYRAGGRGRRPAADGVGRADREGIGGAIGQAGDRGRGGRRAAGHRCGGLRDTAGVWRDRVGRDRRAAVTGAVQVTSADPLPAEAATPVGAAGAVGAADVAGSKHEGGHQPDGAGPGAGRRGGWRPGRRPGLRPATPCRRSGTRWPGGVAGAGGERVAEPGVSVEADGQLIGPGGGGGRAGGDSPGSCGRAGGVGLHIQHRGVRGRRQAGSTPGRPRPCRRPRWPWP